MNDELSLKDTTNILFITQILSEYGSIMCESEISKRLKTAFFQMLQISSSIRTILGYQAGEADGQDIKKGKRKI